MQFEAQHLHYHRSYSDATFEVVLADGVPAGRLYRHRMPEELRIVDIAVLPEFRGRGIGTALLREILDDGAREGLVVSIHVEHMNPAMSLYRRLGFVAAGESGPYVRMEWRPQGCSRSAM
jgi:ribosomal protein S18 acetylase RimI-like enzyme